MAYAWQQFPEAARNSRQNAPAQGIPQGNGAQNAPNAAGMTAGQLAGNPQRYAHPGKYLFDQSTVIRHTTVGLPAAYPDGRGMAQQPLVQFRAPQAQYFHPAPMRPEMGFATPMGQGVANTINARPDAFVHEGAQRQPMPAEMGIATHMGQGVVTNVNVRPYAFMSGGAQRPHMPVGMGFGTPTGQGVANTANVRPGASMIQGAQRAPMPVGMGIATPMGHGAASAVNVRPGVFPAQNAQHAPIPVGMGTGAPTGFGVARNAPVARPNAVRAPMGESAQLQPMPVGMGTIARPNAARAPVAAFSNQPGATAAAAIDLTIDNAAIDLTVDDEPAAATMPARAPASVPNMSLAQHAGSKRGGADSTSHPSTPAAKKPRLDSSAEVDLTSPPNSPSQTAELPAAPTAQAQPAAAKPARGRKRADPYNLMGGLFHTYLQGLPNPQLGETREGEPERPVYDPRQHDKPKPGAFKASASGKGKPAERSEAPAKPEKPASKKKSAAGAVESSSPESNDSDCVVVAPAKPKKSAPTKEKPASKFKSAERVVESPSPEPEESEIVVARPAAVSPVTAAPPAATGPPVDTSEDDAEGVTDDEFVPNLDDSDCEVVGENRASSPLPPPPPPPQQQGSFVPAVASTFHLTSFDVEDTAECLRQQQQLKKDLGEQREDVDEAEDEPFGEQCEVDNEADDEPLGEPLGEGEDLFGEGGEDENAGDGEGFELEPETARELSGESEDEENDGDDESEDDHGLEEEIQEEFDRQREADDDGLGDKEALFRQMTKAGLKTDSDDEKESLYGDESEDE